MLERSRYITKSDAFFSVRTGEKLGMVHIVEEGGFFGVGWSLCHPDDKFDPVEAKFHARARALKDLTENKRRFKDIVNCAGFKELGINLPGTSMKRFPEFKDMGLQFIRQELHSAFDLNLRLCINDIICTCALQYLKIEETMGEN